MAKAVQNKEKSKNASSNAKDAKATTIKNDVAKNNGIAKEAKLKQSSIAEVSKDKKAKTNVVAEVSKDKKAKTNVVAEVSKDKKAKTNVIVEISKDKKAKTNDNGKLKQVTMSYGGKDLKVDLYSKFDFKGFDKATIMKWYKLQHLGRRLDEKAALYLKMAKGWSYHAPFAGHDGIQLALGQVFRASKDFLFPYYRDFLTSLSAGLTPEEIILNGLSKETDVAGGGRHMSNHFAKPSINVQNVSSCTGNHSQHAAGLGRAIKKYNGDEVVFYSGGESACAEGYFFEAISAADFDKSPVVFVIQSNKFGISVPLEEVTTNQNVSDNFRGFTNLKIWNCDGLDAFDSYRVLQEAIKYVKSGKGPAMVHAICDRIGSHSNSDNQENYRTEEVLNSVHRRDPLLQFRYHLLNNKIATQKELEAIEEDNKQEIFAAADKAEAAPVANGASWPEFLYADPYVQISDNTETAIDPNSPKLTYLEGINYALKQEFRRNPNTFMWGEDIGKGGVFNVVKGMPQEFSKNRVFNAPIAEDMIVGTANGFSRYRDDIRLVIEGAEFADYFWPAMEQYIELAHEYWRTKGQNSPNVTLRLASGGYIQGGLYHSQNLEATLSTVPGVRIVQPAFADDAIGLMRNCVRSKGPTMFLEPKYLYNFKPAMGPTPSDDFIIPFGKAKRRREGTDLTIISYGTGVHLSMFAAEEVAKENNISVEIIDLRSLIPWDKEMVFEAIKKTNRVIVVHEDRVTSGFGGEIASTITEHAFKYLDAPILRVGSKDVHVGFAKAYEEAILLNVKDVKAAILKTVNY